MLLAFRIGDSYQGSNVKPFGLLQYGSGNFN